MLVQADREKVKPTLREHANYVGHEVTLDRK